MQNAIVGSAEQALRAARRAKRNLLAIPCPLLILCGPGLQPAWADCRDDFSSCAAASATSGSRCVVTGRVNTVNDLICKVDELRSALNELTNDAAAKAQRGVETAAVRIAAEAQRLQTKMSSTEKFAIEVTRWPVTNSLTQEQRVDGAIVEAELKAALEEVRKLAVTGKDITGSILVLTQQAQSDALEGAQSARNASRPTASASLDGVENWLRGLLTDPDKLFDPSSNVRSVLDSTTNDLNSYIEEIANTVTVKATSELKETELLFKKVAEVEVREKRITNAMENFQLARTAEALKLLYDLVPVADVRKAAVEAPESSSPVIPRIQTLEAAATPQLDFAAVLANLTTSREQAIALTRQRIQEIAVDVAQMKAIALEAHSPRASLSSYQQTLRAQ